MSRKKLEQIACGLVILLAGSLEAVGAEPAALRVGVAETDITPPEGFPMAGYYHERLATGSHDPLKAKAIVLDQGKEKAALVVCDLTGIARDLTQAVREIVSEKTGIPANRIAVTATHSHTAPDYSKDLYEYLAAKKSGKEEAHRYSAKLIEGVSAAVVQAHASLQPVVLNAGSAIQKEPVSFNRRFVMKDGSVRTWQRLDQPDVVRSAGPIDPEIGLISIQNQEGKLISVLSNFALHLDTVGGNQWSGDYPFHIEQVLRRSANSELISIFGTGCCGDINHVDPVKKERNKTDLIGQALGNTIATGLAQLRVVEKPQLRALHAVVPVPLQAITAEQIAQSEPLVAEARAGRQVEFFALVTAYKSLILDQLHHAQPLAKSKNLLSWGMTHHWRGVGATLPVDVQVIAIGRDVAIVCLPGEVFVDLGLAIKQASPFKTTLIIELANCVETVYIPHRAAYAGGSYEVTNSMLQPGSGEMLVEGAVKLLREAAASLEPVPGS